MVEEKVIQPESVAPAEQPVAETATPQAPNLDSVKAEYESKISALEAKIAEEGEKFQGIKTKLDDVYKKADDKRKQTLEDQGQWKTLWEEANKTAQDKDQKILELNQELKNLKSSNESANIKIKASRLNLMMFTKKQMTKGNKTSKTKGNGKPSGKKPTKQPKTKTKKY